MIFTIADNTFSRNSECLDFWTKIWIESKERHFLYIDQNAYDIIVNSNWYESLSHINKEFIDLQFVESNTFKKRDVQLYISEEIEEYYTLLEANEILLKQVSIILENIENDAYFLESIFRCFKNECEKINFHYEKGWWVFENGGGTNIINVINKKKERFEKLPNFKKHPKEYLRTFVVLDSDKKYPMLSEVEPEKQPLLDFVSTYSSYHVTQKREMENYLPDDAFKEIPNNIEFKNAILSLEPVQRDFIDMEKGLADKNINQLEPKELNELYFNLTDDSKKDTLNILRKGKIEFKKDNGRPDNFKSRFPMLFSSELVTKDSLKLRANSNEIEIIIKKINDLL
jgi:hypothetical protein